MKRIAIGVLGVLLLGSAAPSWAQTGRGESTGAQVGYGFGSFLGSAVYFPFKASFCILGGVGGGFAGVLAGPQAAGKTVSATCRGTWVISPDVVRGRERVQFVGTSGAGAPAARSSRMGR